MRKFPVERTPHFTARETGMGGMTERAAAAAVLMKAIDANAGKDLEQRRLCGVAAGDGGQTSMLLVLSG